MRKLTSSAKLAIVGIMFFAAGLIVPGNAVANTDHWCDVITKELISQQQIYPDSNFEPYLAKLKTVRTALDRKDNQTVQKEMGQFFSMLLNQAHGIHDAAAARGLSTALMVTPIQEYRIPVLKYALALPQPFYTAAQ